MGALFQLTTLGDVLANADCTNDVILFVIKRGTANAKQKCVPVAIAGGNVYSVSTGENFAVEYAIERPLVFWKWMTLFIARMSIKVAPVPNCCPPIA